MLEKEESSILNTTGYQVYTTNIRNGEGCYIYDDDGNGYLDMESGVWALPLGHCDLDINRAMHEQIDIMSHCGYKYGQQITESCSEKILEILGFLNGKCVFLSAGSEAVEYGVQLAKCVNAKEKIMCLRNQYFSAYGCSSSGQEKDWMIIEWKEEDSRSIEAYEEWLMQNYDFSEIGVFLFEPGNSSGLVKFPPCNLIAAIQRICKKYGILIVVDEITTGVGRTGKWFGYMHYPILPDIVAIGKGLGNGYPVSAIAMTREIAQKALYSGFHYAQSHQNDSLGCRVAYEVLCKIENNQLLEAVKERAAYLAEGYRKLNERIPVIREVRFRGLLFCVELIPEISEQSMSQIEKSLFTKGFIVAVKPVQRVIRTYCPFIITAEMIDQYLAALESALKEDSFKRKNENENTIY